MYRPALIVRSDCVRQEPPADNRAPSTSAAVREGHTHNGGREPMQGAHLHHNSTGRLGHVVKDAPPPPHPRVQGWKKAVDMGL